MSEKYLKHQLTLIQDRILGGFGNALDELGHPTDKVHLDMFDIESVQRLEFETAAKQLVLKGLLYMDLDRYENETYNLTSKGKALWKIRYQKESESPLPEGVVRRL